MVVDAGEAGAGEQAAAIAAVLTERGLGGDDADLSHRLDQFRRERSRRAEDARTMVKRWSDLSYPSPARRGSGGGISSTGAILSLAYPDRVAKNRGSGGAFLLANGRGGQVDPASTLSREPFLVVAELTGAAVSSRIVLAAAIALEEIEARFADKIEDRDTVTFDANSASLRARRSRRLGSLMLAEQIKQVAPDTETARILAQGIAGLGIDRLDWSKAALQFRTRVGFLRKAEGDEWPDLSNEGLVRSTAEWLEPLLADKTARGQLSAGELFDAVSNLVPWNLRRRLDSEAPTHFTAPTGTQVAVDYEAEQGPTISIRVQELFGLSQHPSLAAGRIAMRALSLRSPRLWHLDAHDPSISDRRVRGPDRRWLCRPLSRTCARCFQADRGGGADRRAACAGAFRPHPDADHRA